MQKENQFFDSPKKLKNKWTTVMGFYVKQENQKTSMTGKITKQ